MKYGTIVADPPWPETGPMHLPAPTRDVPHLATPFNRMTYDQISSMPVERLASSESHLYLWATQRSLRVAYRVCENWGFEPKLLLTWCKRGLGMGFRYYRHSTEFVVFGARGNFPTYRNDRGTWFTGKKGAHSRKPKEFFDLVEDCSPGPFLELFARGNRIGWDVWGHEAPSDLEVSAILGGT